MPSDDASGVPGAVAPGGRRIRQVGEFSEPKQWQLGWVHTDARDHWLDQMPTFGALARLPADELAQVLEGVGTAIDAIVASALTRTKFPEGYDVDQVDDLLDQVIANLRA